MDNFLIVYESPITKKTLAELAVHARHILGPETRFCCGYFLCVNDEDVADMVMEIVGLEGGRVRKVPSRLGREVTLRRTLAENGASFEFAAGKEHVQAETGDQFTVPARITIQWDVDIGIDSAGTFELVVQSFGGAAAPGLTWRIVDAGTGAVLWST